MSSISIAPGTIGVSLHFSNDYKNSSAAPLNTHIDAENLGKFFTKCKYEVFKYKNQTAQKFIATLKTFAQYQYPESCRRLVLSFSGHGNVGVLVSQDNEKVPIDDIITIFKPADAKNPTLGRMVKIYFFDSCRGNKDDPGYVVANGTTKGNNMHLQSNSTNIIANDANIIMGYACTPCYVAHEFPTVGGMWTSYLVEELENPEEDVYHILVNVNDRMKQYQKQKKCQWIQTGEIKSTAAENVHFIKEAGLIDLSSLARSLISSFFEIFSHYGGIHYIADKLKSFILQLGSDELPQNTENLLEELSSTVSEKALMECTNVTVTENSFIAILKKTVGDGVLPAVFTELFLCLCRIIKAYLYAKKSQDPWQIITNELYTSFRSLLITIPLTFVCSSLGALLLPYIGVSTGGAMIGGVIAAVLGKVIQGRQTDMVLKQD